MNGACVPWACAVLSESGEIWKQNRMGNVGGLDTFKVRMSG